MTLHRAVSARGLRPEDNACGGTGSTPARHDNPALTELRHQLGDDRIVDLFVADFLAVVGERVSSVGQLMRTCQAEECVTALFTLETSGAMVGADRLAQAARDMRRALPRGDHAENDRLYALLQAAGHDVPVDIDHE